MALPDVHTGDGHVAAHNTERHAINDLETLVKGAQLPTYAGVRKNPFDGFMYNGKPSNLRRFRAAMGGVESADYCQRTGLAIDNSASGQGNISAEIVVMGDSLTSTVTADNGGGINWANIFAWPGFLRRSLYPDISTARKVPGFTRVNSGSLLDTTMTWSSGWTSAGGLTAIYTNTAGSYFQMISDENCTAASVWYYDFADGAQFEMSANGAVSGPGFLAVNCNGPAGWKKASISGFAATKTIKFTNKLAGKLFMPSGASLHLPNAMIIHNIGQPGSKASGTGNQSWQNQPGVQDTPYGVFIEPNNLCVTVGKTAPDLVLCGLGTNDISGGATPATVSAAMTTIRNMWPNSDFAFILAHRFNDAWTTDAKWRPLASAYYDLADTLDVPLFDWWNLLGDYQMTVDRGLVKDGSGHLTFRGNGLVGSAMARSLQRA